MIKTQFYFRKPIAGFHSIEELFSSIIQHMPEDVLPHKMVVPYQSIGILKRFLNIIVAPFYQMDVNHITGDVHYISLLMRKRKTILTIHDLEIVNRSKPLARKVILFFWFYLPYLRVRYVTVISEFTKTELLKFGNISSEKIKVIHDCIPGEIPFVPKMFHADCPVILHLGTKPNKNLPRLIEAIRGIPCKLVVIGQLEPEQVLLLKDASIRYDNLFDLPYAKVIDRYKNADIISFVSTYEGFGLPILEAQSIGRPVLTSNLSSMPEVAGEGAMYVDPLDVASIRQGILDLINDAVLREDLVRKGMENIKRFKPDNIAEQYAALYREIVK